MGVDAGTPPGLWERVRKIAAEEVAKFMRSGFLRNASITGGGLSIRGGFLRLLAGGVQTFYVGPVTPAMPDGSAQQGWIVRREDGSTALALYDPDPASGGFFQFLALYDRAGNIVMSDDTDSGQGLARPYVPGTFHRTRYADFSVSTVSGTWETLWDTYLPKQHPRLAVGYRASMDTSGTSGEVRVMVGTTQVGATTAEGFAITTRDIGPAPVPGGHMETLRVEIQARRLSTSGALRVEPLYVRGVQS